MDATFYMQLDQFYGQGQYDQAERFLLDTLHEAESDEKNHADRATVLNEIMGFYRVKGDFANCEHYLKALLREMRSMHLRDGLTFATLTLNIANAYRAMGRLDEAERNFLRVKDIYLAELEPDDYRLASLYNNLSLVYRARGTNDLAYDYLVNALEIIRKLQGAEVPTAATCTNLADILLEMERVQEAERYARTAVGILEASAERPAEDYAAALSIMGRVCFAKGDYPDAKRSYEQAAEVMTALGKTKALETIRRNLEQVEQKLS